MLLKTQESIILKSWLPERTFLDFHQSLNWYPRINLSTLLTLPIEVFWNRYLTNANYKSFKKYTFLVNKKKTPISVFDSKQYATYEQAYLFKYFFNIYLGPTQGFFAFVFVLFFCLIINHSSHSSPLPP